MKKYQLFLLLLLAAGCATPSRLGINYKGQPIYKSSANQIDNPNIDLVVTALTKQDIGSDIRALRNRFVSYVYKNEDLASLIKQYPGTKIGIEITPAEHIKRTWIFDIMFFEPYSLCWWPFTPWWGTTDLNAKMTVTIPSEAKSKDYTFSASEPFKIHYYPYYVAGRKLTQNYSVAYGNLFEQVSKFNFSELNSNPISSVASPVNKSEKYSFRARSDVDTEIPDLGQPNKFRFALIIGNEDYASQQSALTVEANVEFARNDASAFREYAIHELGIPQENTDLILDATTGKMKQALNRLSLLAKNSQGNAEIYFFYAGHGLPDETSKESYLIPVDISGSNVTDGIKLADAYRILTDYKCKKVTVFLDACFSGGARNQGLISSRGVRIAPKGNILYGNLVVFSASSGEQSSLGYASKEHGLFTYFLLKKLKDSKANITYKELSEYLIHEVGLNSVLINNKEQNPQVNVSPQINDQWQDWKFR